MIFYDRWQMKCIHTYKIYPLKHHKTIYISFTYLLAPMKATYFLKRMHEKSLALVKDTNLNSLD